MNMFEEGWFGQLSISGVSQPIKAEGIISDVIGNLMDQLQKMNPRELADGKEISLVLRNREFATMSKDTLAFKKKVAEVEDGLIGITDEGMPLPSELYEQFYDRQRARGMNHYSAEWLANEWFARTQNPALTAWLSDPRAELFRKLNSVNKAYEAATPTEYESLKRYVMENHPEFVRDLVFRTA